MIKVDWNIIFDIINVVVLYLLMRKFLFGPIMKIMENRTNTIQASLLDAENKNQDALKLKQEYDEMLKNAEEKAAIIINEANQRAADEHEKQIKETKAEIERMMEEANRTIELERKKSMENIQSEIAGIAMAAATKILQKNVDESLNRQLMNDFFNEAGGNK